MSSLAGLLGLLLVSSTELVAGAAGRGAVPGGRCGPVRTWVVRTWPV